MENIWEDTPKGKRQLIEIIIFFVVGLILGFNESFSDYVTASHLVWQANLWVKHIKQTSTLLLNNNYYYYNKYTLVRTSYLINVEGGKYMTTDTRVNQ